MKRAHHLSVITVLPYALYIVFFVYFSGSMRRMDTVHSRVGLCFTGLVEILVSTIASLSVCALGGLKITMVPWQVPSLPVIPASEDRIRSILPAVVIVVGAENMFRLVRVRQAIICLREVTCFSRLMKS